jgi:DNA helicase-2/ATP-dependent DNA helicase PcrA
MNPEELEEERRLCYVGMTRAMNTLILTRAHYRRRYGNDAPEMSVPSRFLEEVPNELVENLGGRSPAWSTPAYNSRASGYATGYGSARRPSQFSEFADQHYNYEDESQESLSPAASSGTGTAVRSRGFGASTGGSSGKPFVASWMTAKTKSPSPSVAPASTGNKSNPDSKGPQAPEAPPDERSIDNIARFFAGKARGGKAGAFKPGAFPRPSMIIPASTGAANLKKGQRVRHSKYGEGTILMREGEGEDAKLTVQFTRHGLKKLMEKFANLQKL